MPSSADRHPPHTQQRRLVLRVLTKLLIAIGVVVLLGVLLASLVRNDPEREGVAVVDLRPLKVGQAQKVRWQQHPVWIVRRDVFDVDALPAESDALLDRGTQEAPLPLGVNPYHRGLDKRYLVVLARGVSCDVEWREGQGFYEPCVDLHYDLAGRLKRAASLPLGAAHLQVPDHRIAGASLVIGQPPESEENNEGLW